MAELLTILEDALIDVAKLIPFLFVTYLLMEWMEHETGQKLEHFLERHRRIAPFAGALFGLIPECGFSSASSSLYTSHVISAGTLIAVYLSTSDEMLPILISNQAPVSTILKILSVKFIVALGAGYLADSFSRHDKTDIESFCEREECECENGVLKSALIHTLKITVWLFAITFLIDAVMDSFGMDAMKALITGHPSVSVVTCSLLGMIPSCASSILLTTLYLDGVISFASVCAGLLANAGVGIMVLFRVNPDKKNNLKIVGYVWLVSFISGLLLELIF